MPRRFALTHLCTGRFCSIRRSTLEHLSLPNAFAKSSRVMVGQLAGPLAAVHEADQAETEACRHL